MGKMVNKNYLSDFKNRRVFITGHTGFKGSWLAFLLNEIGADVLGYALPPVDKNNHFNLLGLENKIHHVVNDIRDEVVIRNTMSEFQPEFVFHLAAQALVRPSYQDPKTTFDTNVSGSVNILEAVRQCTSVRSLVYITSDKCYENHNWVWGYRENDMLGGYDPYSASKAAAEIIFSAYSRSYFSNRPELGAASTRAGNVIGGGDWSQDRIIPDCIKAIQSGYPIKIRSPNATRPWQHVLEPLSGYLQLAARLYEEPKRFSGAWNFGPNCSEVRTVRDVAEYMITHYGEGSIEVEFNDTDTKHEAMLLKLNCDKAHQVLGWQPRWDLDKTLIETAQWYKSINDGAIACDTTLNQIKDYFRGLI
jgi:CDP-glucose 4,6-dehydratase